MDKRDVEEFIEEMEEMGDVWQELYVYLFERVYGEYTLAEALADRKASIGIFGDIISKVLNR